ncbi:hypothetical protein [Geodermatophilus maliterrae]|uniref:Uncharacterized protein n=1 Tax=Geodermatophilus maliterrae TaxID=3162531 RepID=A0ABV3XDX1_9ACTN
MALRHTAAVVTGVLVAAGLGLLAGVLGDDDQFWLRTTVFAACTLGPAYGLGWLLFVSGSAGPDAVLHPEENVEHGWWQRSASGSFLDLLVVLGLAATALAVTGLRLDAGSVLAALIVVALADVTVRMAVLSRREA